MNVKKTIAAIAAAAITASAMSVAVLADNTPNAGISTYAVPDRDHSGETEQGVDGVNGTGEIDVTTGDDGKINVNVTLKPAVAGGSIEGTLQGGTSTENYHVIINVPGIDSSWSFTSGYGDDDEHNHGYNFGDGQLKLWLPITEDGTYTIKIGKGEDEKTIVVTTIHGEIVEVTEPEPEPEPEAPAETPEEETPEETTPPAEGDDEDLPSEDEEPEDVLPPSAGTLPSLVPGSSSSAEAVPAETVASPADVSASRNPSLTVDAASTPVSTAMVEAFVKNDSAKTMTLSYGSALKIAVDKDDITDAEAANLDFSVSGKNFLTKSVIAENEVLSTATKIVQIDFVNEGKIDGVDKVTVRSKVGVKLAGKTVTVFEYVNGKLVKLGTSEVTASGYVKFKTDHFGQFVIAVE